MDFTPHGYCIGWNSALVWSFLISDGVIALSYLAISITLLFLVRRLHKVIPLPNEFRYIPLLFSGFILLCSLGHLIKGIEIWYPIYRIHAVENSLTAGVSALTALVLPSLLKSSLTFVGKTQQLEQKEQQFNLVEEERNLAYEELAIVLRQIRTKNKQMTLLSELAGSLFACKNHEEAYEAIGVSLRKLFDGISGELFALSSSRNYFDLKVSWGISSSEPTFNVDDCWAYRRKKINLLPQIGEGLLCAHILKPSQGCHLCIPLDQGEAIGILHLQGEVLSKPEFQEIAILVAQNISLNLGALLAKQNMTELATRDALTKLSNLNHFTDLIDRALALARRKTETLSLILLDIDFFKQCNDTYGHEAANVMLQAIADVLRNNTRESDILCRYGGEELIVALLQTGVEGAAVKAEELRKKIAEVVVYYQEHSISVTASFGVATYPIHGKNREELIRAADKAMYCAKHEGRNRVVIAS